MRVSPASTGSGSSILVMARSVGFSAPGTASVCRQGVIARDGVRGVAADRLVGQGGGGDQAGIDPHLDEEGVAPPAGTRPRVQVTTPLAAEPSWVQAGLRRQRRCWRPGCR